MDNELYVSGIIYAIEQIHQFRDDCAISALKGVFTSPIASSTYEKEYIAMHCYKMADEMLKAKFN